ncbi:MAG: C69 family dipeptidase [Bacteroidales bacterium]|nr:C69 family dipeptidase [Bacteroidales bacterium]
MRRLSTAILISTLTAFGLSMTDSNACTNVLVTKGASTDGSNMISYAADSHQLYGELYYAPAGVWQPGDLRKIYEWDTGKYLGDIPQISRTYQRVGNMNDHQLIIAETTYGGRAELWDSTGVMDYGSLIYVALERARTAREAIDVIVDLANTYGYYSSGESFSFADKDEVWVMDLIGKGPDNKGIVWVARRVPDGYICAHANQARISTFPLNDPENCIYAPDVISFAREKGYFSGKDEDFSFCDAYAPLDFSGMRACEARAWAAFNILCDGRFTFLDENGNEVTKDAYDYIDYAMGYDKTKRFPLFVKPERKISVKDVADVMRDHYEGTPMDMTADIGAGGNALPYRWRPMGFGHDGKEYINERAIATQQTGFWFVGQNRSHLPDEIGGIIWFGCDDAATSYLTPIYTSTTEVPECFREGNGDMITYSPTSAFWMTNRVANACYKAYNIMFPTVDAEIDAWETAMMEAVTQADKEALAIYKEADAKPRKAIRRNDKMRKTVDPYTEVRTYLTDFSVRNARKIFDRWVALEELLLVKFIDGNVKAQNPDGSFVTNGYTDCIPDKITQPGYTDTWKAVVAKEHGNTVQTR